MIFVYSLTCDYKLCHLSSQLLVMLNLYTIYISFDIIIFIHVSIFPSSQIILVFGPFAHSEIVFIPEYCLFAKESKFKAKRSNILIKKGQKHQLFHEGAFIAQYL